ncbi:hypothetical protein [uncultured Campylobacter sp.]|uniref:hypothetical protein n=1 Tax=uncultured Campylobacter sp. TaxID=218934 RepID=UPI0026024265|nr:hypothetical protein [uncultured Campylobacter sp.]
MILICTALRCEAQAIIESFKLTRSGDLFAGEQMLLYICGVRFGAKFKAGAAGGIEIEFKSEPGAEFVRRTETDAEFGRELRKDRRGADIKFKHRLGAGALCGDAETGSARNVAENFEISDFGSAQNSERFGEILLSRRVDFALNIGVCGCADKGVQIGEAFYFDGTAAREFCGEDRSKFYRSQVGEHSEQAPKFQNVCEREFCGASLDGKLRANLICVSEPKILNAAQRTRGANVAEIEACGEINAQAPTQGVNGSADTKNFTRDATRAEIQSLTQVKAQNLSSVKPSQIAVGGHSVATNTAARATQNTPCTAKDATCGCANRGIRLYDMESALFVSACERVGVPWAMMKIVSDHLRGERLCKSFVYELVKARLPQICAAIKSRI